jgi:NADH:ubiquinone oxidoreductase subunit E
MANVTENLTAQDLRAALSEIKEKYPSAPDQLIPMLQFAQDKLGYLPVEAMTGIAEYLKVPASHVYGVATFYAQFRFQPLGKNRVTVCRGTACHVRGSARILDDLQKSLKIKPGETSPDLSFSLETVACIGSCALAPVLVINNKVHGKATSQKTIAMVDSLKNGGEQPGPATLSPAPEAEPKRPAHSDNAPTKPSIPDWMTASKPSKTGHSKPNHPKTLKKKTKGKR